MIYTDTSITMVSYYNLRMFKCNYVVSTNYLVVMNASNLCGAVTSDKFAIAMYLYSLCSLPPDGGRRL